MKKEEIQTQINMFRVYASTKYLSSTLRVQFAPYFFRPLSSTPSPSVTKLKSIFEEYRSANFSLTTPPRFRKELLDNLDADGDGMLTKGEIESMFANIGANDLMSVEEIDSVIGILGDGNSNSPIMLIGETPGEEEENSGLTFMGQIGDLLKKMLIAINIKKENIYSTYAVNFRPPEDRKPTSYEIKRYSQFLQKHISIIKPKIIILMGSTAMESLTGLNSKISVERGKWKEVIVKNTTYDVIITFNPSYLLRVPENKKHSWEDLKKIQQKIIDLKLSV